MSLNLIPHTAAPLADLLTRAAFAPIENVGWLRVTGSDRVRWLNGMVTNNIAALKPGEGCYNFFLNAQGRIQADATAWMLEDSILLQTASPGSLATMLDRFIIMDDVELDVWESGGPDRKWFAENTPKFPRPVTRAGLLLAGPDVPALLTTLGLSSRSVAEGSASLFLQHLTWQSTPLDLIEAQSPLVPRFELWSDPATIGLITEAIRANGAAEASPSDLEQLRILSGTPLYGTDIRNSETARDLPQETNQNRALHFAKGCYLGQEIVERIRSRGAVHRTFTGFILHGDPVQPGTILTADSKPVGELTSVTTISSELLAQSSKLPETSPLQIALGYIRREALEKRTPIIYPGGTATPTTLPFQILESRT